jgi:hypothetical protein
MRALNLSGLFVEVDASQIVLGRGIDPPGWAALTHSSGEFKDHIVATKKITSAGTVQA